MQIGHKSQLVSSVKIYHPQFQLTPSHTNLYWIQSAYIALQNFNTLHYTFKIPTGYEPG